ncbi:PepSY domain-containing protein [Corynebacterium sp. HMSC05D03]|uniref:PepSY-associated TM helix domain-containing protein n=1 Tax=Corynebacterium sp. HMSC05D03 TaxID=1581115 RepID=UPI000A9304F4|nr:PepSY-associated TM helix domain-containing protein [Corynebacterium sp. HMSC05D03]
MSRTALRSFIQRIHFYGGMFVGPFILVAALTGCLYAMAPTLEKVVYHDVMSVPAVEHPVSLEEQIQAAQHEVIGDYPTYSGLGEMPLRRWISSLHESFHLGKIGELYSELAASWLWVMACGGLYMWWIRRRPKNKATANAAHQQPKRSARWKATRLHSTVGAWIFIGLLGLSATGITWSGLAGDNVDSLVERMQWKATPIETALPGTTAETHEHTMHEGHEGHGVGGASSSTNIAAEAERVLATGRAEGLTGPLRLYPPEDVHSAWQVSERWVEWRTTSDAISVDGATGDVIDRQPFSSLPLFSKLSS